MLIRVRWDTPMQAGILAQALENLGFKAYSNSTMDHKNICVDLKRNTYIGDGSGDSSVGSYHHINWEII